MNPLLVTVRPDFLLPDRDNFLERIDQPPTSFECILTVRAAHRDDHAHLAQVEIAHAMDERSSITGQRRLASSSSSAIFLRAIPG